VPPNVIWTSPANGENNVNVNRGKSSETGIIVRFDIDCCQGNAYINPTELDGGATTQAHLSTLVSQQYTEYTYSYANTGASLKPYTTYTITVEGFYNTKSTTNNESIEERTMSPYTFSFITGGY
jgi:hypothetical protein